ncbi:MAG: AraC family transcriptional regulator [bacterium]
MSSIIVKDIEVFKDIDFPFFVEHGTLNNNYELHSHEFIELFIIVKGKSGHIIGNVNQEIHAGDIFVIKSNELEHGFINPKGLELFNFSFSNKFLEGFCREIYHIPGYQTLFVISPFLASKPGYRNYFKLPPKGLITAIDLANKICKEQETEKIAYKTMIKSLFIELIVHLLREYEKPPGSKETKNIKRLEKSLVFLEKNYRQRPSISQLADIACISERQFQRIFKNCFHTTPLYYINSLRLRDSKYFLAEKKYSIAEIAYKCGFDNPNYFTRAFKKEFGIPPTKYLE